MTIPLKTVPRINVCNVRSENALGTGTGAGAGVNSDTAFIALDALIFLDGVDEGNNERTPRTDNAVENKVKKNPTMMTTPTFKSYKMQIKTFKNDELCTTC